MGLENLVLVVSMGGLEAEVNAVRYNLHYSTNQSIPFYLFFTAKSEKSDDSSEGVSSKFLGADSGLLNFKFADDLTRFDGNNGNGLCDFKGDTNGFGGCYLNWQLGGKLLDYKDDKGKDKQMGAFYFSLQGVIDFAITEGTSLTKAGRLVGAIGLSGYYANTDDVKHLFPEFEDNDVGKVDDLKKWYASVDAGLYFTISDTFSAKASVSHPLVNEDVFDTIVKFNVTWTPESD